MWLFWFLPLHVHWLLQTNTYPFSSYTAIAHITPRRRFAPNPPPPPPFPSLSTHPYRLKSFLSFSPSDFSPNFSSFCFLCLIFLRHKYSSAAPSPKPPFNSCEELNRIWGFFQLVIIISFPPFFLFFFSLSFSLVCLCHNLCAICRRTLQHWGSVHLWECFLVLCG